MNLRDRISTFAAAIKEKLQNKQAPTQEQPAQDDPKELVYEIAPGQFVNGLEEPCDRDGNVFEQAPVHPEQHGVQPGAAAQKQAPEKDLYAGYNVVETAGFHTWLQRNTIKLAMALGVPIIWLIASYGVAQFLSGFRPLSWDVGIIIGYLSAGSYELFGIAFLFVAVRNKDQKKSYWGAIVIALFVALSSFIGQYLLLYSEAFRHLLFIPPEALAGLPIDQRGAILFRSKGSATKSATRKSGTR